MSGVDGRAPESGAETSSDVLSAGLRRKQDGHVDQRLLAFRVTHVLLSILFLWLLFADSCAVSKADSISFLHAVGLFFFTKGFLLTRLVLENQSNCTILPDGSPAPVVDGCWHPRSFEKAVVIVVDALRYDFTVPFQSSVDDIMPHLYHNNLPSMYSSAVNHPENALLLPFIADPPTSTLQRLQGLTAGNLPTFIDISSSFGGQATEEDNILVQLRNAGKKIVHLGDDTWHSLFPGYFDQNLTHAYDSFNVWDLHTVDNGVIEHIFPLLRNQNTSTWDVVFAHFLGVDHAGHRYGPNHPAMAEKLQQMNQVIKDISEAIDDDTLLVVMGDHGMDSKGDHGGESDDEIEAALWMYSKKPRFGRLQASHVTPPSTAKERPVEQIDLVSTLSLLLGLPIPFNNLGTPIVEAFIGPSNKDWKNLADVNLLAFKQIQRYQTEYTKSRELEIDAQQQQNLQRVDDAVSSTNRNRWQAVNDAYSQWHRDTISMYRRLWANFNTMDMLLGVVLSTIGLLVLVLLYQSSAPKITEDLPGILRNIGLITMIGWTLSSTFSTFIPSMGRYTGALYGGSVCGALYAIFRVISLSGFQTLLPRSVLGWLSLIFTVTQAAGFASNSYTIHEDTILHLFLTTFGAFALMSSLRQALRSDRILGAYHSILFLALTRVASYSRLCREEQMPGCRSTFYASQTSSTSAPWQLLIPFFISILLPEIVKAFYRGTASYTGSAPFWLGFSFRIGLLFVAAYWTIDTSENSEWLKSTFTPDTIKTIGISLARCALAIAVPVGIGTFLWAKPCIDISIANPATSPTTLASTDLPAKTKPQITILGYANTFGSRYFLVLPILILSTILLLPPMGQLSFSLLTWQILSLLEILDTNAWTISSDLSRSSSSIGPIVLALLGSFHFFKTGHTATLSSIQWSNAFIPLRTITYPWSPILIVLNTFGPQILCAAAVPLTVLWKRPVNAARGLHGVWSDVMKACMAHVLYYAVIQLACTMWAGHLRRHLMLYRVFMPRFLMGSVLLLVVDLVLVFVALGATKISAESVGAIFGY